MTYQDLSDIVKIQETHSQTEANELLSEGWVLLNIYTTIFSLGINDQMNIYVLGKLNGR